jgi:hypothetical protein
MDMNHEQYEKAKQLISLLLVKNVVIQIEDK